MSAATESPSTGLAEIVLVVDDVLTVAAFYRDVVGLAVEHDATESWAWFWAGDVGASQRLAISSGPLFFEEHSPHPEGKRWGNVHFAFTVPQDRLDAALERLRAAGCEIHGPTHFEWMAATSYYFYDPAGNLAEFWVPD